MDTTSGHATVRIPQHTVMRWQGDAWSREAGAMGDGSVGGQRGGQRDRTRGSTVDSTRLMTLLYMYGYDSSVECNVSLFKDLVARFSMCSVPLLAPRAACTTLGYQTLHLPLLPPVCARVLPLRLILRVCARVLPLRAIICVCTCLFSVRTVLRVRAFVLSVRGIPRFGLGRGDFTCGQRA